MAFFLLTQKRDFIDLHRFFLVIVLFMESAIVEQQIFMVEYLIKVKEFTVDAVIGYYEPEREQTQPVGVEFSLVCECGERDDSDLSTVVDYSPCLKEITEKLQSDKPRLIETAAQMVAEILLKDTRVKKATITISKPEIFDNGIPSVTITRYQNESSS